MSDMGNGGHLEELYRRHAQAVFRFAYGLCRNKADAEDLVAETFARVMLRANRIESATARAYLFATARNAFLDGRRRAARHARFVSEVQASPSAQPEQTEVPERLAYALAALGALPEGERAALLLRIDHEMTYDDIATTLGVSVAAAKVRVHRARLKLANAWAFSDQVESGGSKKTPKTMDLEQTSRAPRARMRAIKD